MNHAFQPGNRKGRNRYVGSWTETGWREIALPFTSESLVAVLSWGAGAQRSEHTHQDIAHWCDRFHMAYVTDHWGRDEEATIRPFADIAQDVSAQWELHLSNTYTLEQLQTLTFSTVALPAEWFQNWLQTVKELQS